MTLYRPPYKNSGNPPNIVRYLHDSNANHPVYEREDFAHGVNCKCCTKIEQSERLAEEWRQKIQALHKGRNERRRQKQQEKQQQERDNWHSLGDVEDFEI